VKEFKIYCTETNVCFQEATSKSLRSLAYTVTERNATKCYSQYIVIGMGDPCQLETVSDVWISAFKTTDVFYFADKDALQGIHCLIIAAC